jgi:hypothetical protein
MIGGMDYEDYYWDKGVPKGRNLSAQQGQTTYKIFSDPYRKRYSVEEYHAGAFQKVLYDSSLFDFRSLFKEEDASWQRETISETATSAHTLIRNMEERIVLKEELNYTPEGDCTGCTLYSCHGVLLGRQMIFNQNQGAPFNGVEFRDVSGRIVLQKEYEKNQETGAFETLIRQCGTFKH